MFNMLYRISLLKQLLIACIYLIVIAIYKTVNTFNCLFGNIHAFIFEQITQFNK